MPEMAEPLKWYDPNGENTPWMTALYNTRKLATREGYCWQPVGWVERLHRQGLNPRRQKRNPSRRRVMCFQSSPLCGLIKAIARSVGGAAGFEGK